MWEPKHGKRSVGGQACTVVDLLEADTGVPTDCLPAAMDDRVGWRKKAMVGGRGGGRGSTEVDVAAAAAVAVVVVVVVAVAVLVVVVVVAAAAAAAVVVVVVVVVVKRLVGLALRRPPGERETRGSPPDCLCRVIPVIYTLGI